MTSEALSPIIQIVPEASQRDLKYLRKMKTLAYLTAQFGQRFPNNGPDRIDWKAILTTEHLDSKNFVATELQILGSNTGFEHGYFTIYRCLPAKANDLASHYERAVNIELDSSGIIGVRVMPEFFPECSEFETPLANPQFSRPRQITKEMFLGSKMLVRGPLTSLGPITKDFIYKVTDEAYKLLFY